MSGLLGATTGTLYELESVKDYWKGWPQGDANRPASVVYRIMREPAAQKAALLRGEADIVEGLTSDDFAQITRQKGIVVEEYPSLTAVYIKLNNQKGPTADKNVRKALAYAFDYEAAAQIWNGAAQVRNSVFPDGLRGYVAVPDMPKRDLEKAKAFLAKSAFSKGFTIEYAYLSGMEENRRVGLMMVDNFAALNIKVEVRPEQWPNIIGKGSKPETAFDMAATYDTPSTNDPDSLASHYLPSGYGQYWGMSFYQNPEVAKKIEDARRLTDWNERAKLYSEAQAQIVDDAPDIFGPLLNRRWARRDYLKGFTFSPVRQSGEFDLYGLWIDAK